MRNFVKSQVLSSKLQLAAVAFAISTLGFGIFVNAQGRGGQVRRIRESRPRSSGRSRRKRSVASPPR